MGLGHFAHEDRGVERRRAARLPFRDARLRDAPRHGHVGRDVDELGLHVHDAFPEQRTALRCDERPGVAVAVDDGDLAGARLDAQEQILDGFGLPPDEVVQQAVLEGRLREVETLDVEALPRIEEAIDGRRQEALEVAVPEQDATLVLAHGELACEQHGPSPKKKKPRWSYQPGLLFPDRKAPQNSLPIHCSKGVSSENHPYQYSSGRAT